jgi:hypothetical protein
VHGVHVLRKPFSVPALALWCGRARIASSTTDAATTAAVPTACFAEI